MCVCLYTQPDIHRYINTPNLYYFYDVTSINTDNFRTIICICISRNKKQGIIPTCFIVF